MAGFLLSNLPHWGRTRFGPESGLWGSTGLIMPKTEFMAGHLQFFWAGVVKHLQTGSVIPCQRFLVQRMIAPIPANYTGRVVELGSGTGGLTMRLAARCPKATILAREINPVLAEITRRNLLKAGVMAGFRSAPSPRSSFYRSSWFPPQKSQATLFRGSRLETCVKAKFWNFSTPSPMCFRKTGCSFRFSICFGIVNTSVEYLAGCARFPCCSMRHPPLFTTPGIANPPMSQLARNEAIKGRSKRKD